MPWLSFASVAISLLNVPVASMFLRDVVLIPIKENYFEACFRSIMFKIVWLKASIRWEVSARMRSRLRQCTVSRAYWAIFVVLLFLTFERLGRPRVIFAPLLFYQATVRWVDMSGIALPKCFRRPIACATNTFKLLLAALRSSLVFAAESEVRYEAKHRHSTLVRLIQKTWLSHCII